ncbi:MAG: ubiquinone biosynthesis regulatory protein kinase UbiB [Proteobacteria bacterium]|nr:MAG: ubiquinone biosynthesis regulatory protein kinase UbiB [Pseudomonadota bacterium]
MRIFRLFKIILTFKRYGLFQILTINDKTSRFAGILAFALWFIPQKHKDKSLPVRVKLAFEHLGPVFVKFGQLLSTRPDLIPSNYIAELAHLQSKVRPFDTKLSKQIIENSINKPINEVFSEFIDTPVASASIAQVHRARLAINNHEVAVKVLRPGIAKIIDKDIKVLKLAALVVEKLFSDGKRLRPQEVIDEFETTIHEELDFLQEAANSTELARLHKNDKRIIIPDVYYDYTTKDVIVMEWMNGITISDIPALKAQGIDLEKLSHYGVEIFYTQVFHFGFFHADMHPGNILCSNDGRYIALDFGIVGCLSDEDKRYLAINILAFFNRDYKKVAITHVESGWAPKDTPIEQFENAIRAVCEPIFNKPLAQISFAQVLIKLFQVSRRFGIVVQPQLILLQKTIVNVEGMGRILNPELDLWKTAKPILNKWLREQMGVKGFVRNLKSELPHWSYVLPTIPRNFATALTKLQETSDLNQNYNKLVRDYRRMSGLLAVMVIVLTIILVIKL